MNANRPDELEPNRPGRASHPVIGPSSAPLVVGRLHAKKARLIHPWHVQSIMKDHAMPVVRLPSGSDADTCAGRDPI